MSDFKINSIATKQGQHGPVIAGVSTINSTGCMKIPSGPTENRGGRGRFVFSGGYYPSPHPNINTLNFVEIATTGDAVDFGDLSVTRTAQQMGMSGTRGLFGGGGAPGMSGSRSNVIDYITFQSGGGANDFGDLTFPQIRHAGVSNGVRGVFCGGYSGDSPYHRLNTIQTVNIATIGNSAFFGELSVNADTDGSVSDRTRGCVAGHRMIIAPQTSPSSTQTDIIDFITTAVGGTAQDFGDLTVARRVGNGCSSSRTRGLFYSGSPGPGPHRNTIDFITIQTKGNAVNFGDLTTFGNQDGASHGSSLTRSVNRVNSDANTIEFVTIATLGNTQDFGDSTHAAASKGGMDNSNGSIT